MNANMSQRANLSVGGNLHLGDTAITAVPAGVKVGGKVFGLAENQSRA
jgi:hypothetical protein